MIYSIKFKECVPFNRNEKSRWMKNSLQGRIRTVLIYNNVIWIEKRFDDVSDNYLRSITKILKRFCHNISERHNSIFEHIEKIQSTRQTSS